MLYICVEALLFERKINTINRLKENFSEVPDIETGDWLFDSKINAQI